MSQQKTITQNPNYDVSAGVTNFDIVRIESNGPVTVQVFHNGLDAADLNLRLEQSIDEDVSDFNDVLDGAGNEVESEIDNTDNSHTFNINGFTTDYARLVIQSVGAVTAGTITKIIWRIGK